MKHIISVILISLLVICLFGVSPAVTPVRAQEGSTHYYYLPLVGRQLPLNPNNRIGGNYSHNCVVTPWATVKCWGNGHFGSLGGGDGDPFKYLVDVVGLNAPVTAIAVGFDYTCALNVNGGVQCWGKNASGQLGDNTMINRSSAVNVVGLSSGIKAISTGGGHTCALTEIGGVLCWGANTSGQLGDGTYTPHYQPTSVPGMTSGVRAVSAAGSRTCVITELGGVKCWGNNEYGQLGDGTNTSSAYPVDVIGLSAGSGVLAISASESHTCALTTENGVKCWGYGSQISLPKFVSVPGLENNVIAISVGYYNSCVLTSAGGVKCWGENWSGEVGDGTKERRDIPVDVVGLNSGVQGVATSNGRTCALLAKGVKCWGFEVMRNPYTSSTTPVDVISFP